MRGLITAARAVITTVAAAGAVVASFVFLTGLAAGTGWPGWSASLLPLSVDALAAGAWLSYWTATDRDARRFAGRIGVVATAASLAGNALSHLLVTGQVRPGWFLVAMVGSVPAVSLALVVKMAVPVRVWPGGSVAAAEGPGRAGEEGGSGTAGTAEGDSPVPVPVKTPDQPMPVPVEVSPPPPGTGTGRRSRTEAEWAVLVTQIREHDGLSHAELAKRLRVSKSTVGEAKRRAALNGHGA